MSNIVVFLCNVPVRQYMYLFLHLWSLFDITAAQIVCVISLHTMLVASSCYIHMTFLKGQYHHNQQGMELEC